MRRVNCQSSSNADILIDLGWKDGKSRYMSVQEGGADSEMRHWRRGCFSLGLQADCTLAQAAEHTCSKEGAHVKAGQGDEDAFTDRECCGLHAFLVLAAGRRPDV